MGIAFVIVIYLVLYAVISAILSLAAWGVRRALGPNRPKLRRFVTIAPFFIAAAPLCIFLGRIVWANIEPPFALYQTVFDRLPDQDVERLQGHASAFNDYDEVFLAFARSKAALDRSLASASFVVEKHPMEDDALLLSEPYPPPTWWRAPSCPQRSVYVARNTRKWDQIVVTDCRSNDTVYVQARWID